MKLVALTLIFCFIVLIESSSLLKNFDKILQIQKHLHHENSGSHINHHHKQHHQHQKSIRHRRNVNQNTDDDSLEDLIKIDLKWLNEIQLDVLKEMREDGSNITELQKEIFVFYNNLKGYRRLKAAESILSDFSSFVNAVATEEEYRDHKRNSMTEFQQFFDERTNDTTKASGFMNVCVPLLAIESKEFIRGAVRTDTEVESVDIEDLDKNVENLMIKANVLFKMYKMDAAISAYNSVLSMNPENVEALEKKADAMLFLGMFDTALKLYDEVLNFDPENLGVIDKKIDTFVKKSDENQENADLIIFQTHFEPNLNWLNETQAKFIRRMKAEGKKITEIFGKITEFYDEAFEGDEKQDAIHFMEHGCLRLLFIVLGHENAGRLLNLREMSFSINFEIIYDIYFKNIKEEGRKRIAGIFMSKCSKVLAFDEEETPSRIMIDVKIGKEVIQFQHDTGADRSIVPKSIWEKIGKPQLYSSRIQFRSYTGEITVLGRCRVWVEVNGIKKREWLFVTDEGDALFGRDWMKRFNIKSE